MNTTTNFQITAQSAENNSYLVEVKGLDNRINVSRNFTDPLKAMKYMFLLSKRLRLNINRLDLAAVSLDYQRAKAKALEAAFEQQKAVDDANEAISSMDIPQPTQQPLQLEFKEDGKSPLMEQWTELKKKHPEALLLFRCGDFYETYGEDAENAAKVLGITLTTSSKHADKMAGFPYHALDTYLPKLIRNGFRVAICDQIEDGKPKAKRGRKPKKEA